GDGARLAVFDDDEVCGRETVNGATVRVGHTRVYADSVRGVRVRRAVSHVRALKSGERGRVYARRQSLGVLADVARRDLANRVGRYVGADRAGVGYNLRLAQSAGDIHHAVRRLDAQARARRHAQNQIDPVALGARAHRDLDAPAAAVRLHVRFADGRARRRGE